MPQIALQTVDVAGIPYTEYRYEPDHSNSVQLGNSRYITAVTAPNQSTNRYLVTLMHRFTGQQQLVDLVIPGSGFSAMASELRQHFDHDWEIYHWLDGDTPF